MEIQRNWEKATREHYLLTEDAPLVVELSPLVKDHILTLNTALRSDFDRALFKLIDERIAKWLDRGSRKPGKALAQIGNTPLYLRRRPEGCLLAEYRGDGYSLQNSALRFTRGLPDTTAQSMVGKDLHAIIEGLGGPGGNSPIVIKWHRTPGGGTVLRLSSGEPCNLTYRELYGDPRARFAKDDLALAS